VKILLLADGRSIHTVRYQKELQEQGINVTLASLEPGETADIQLKKKSVSNSLNYFFSNREIKELVGKIAPDLVNAHFASGYGFSTALSGVWKKVPVVLHCLGSDILISPGKSIGHKRKVIYALSRAHHIFVDSRYLADKVQELVPTKDISIIPWGTDVESLALFATRDEIEFAAGQPVKVIVPRPHNKVYNNMFIISSLCDLINKRELTITFPDWGDDYDEFRTFAKEKCLDGSIGYYHFMPRGDYLRFAGGFDVYLSAALSDSSPASLIEAMALGLFPIVGDIPGVRDWVNGENGILYDPYNNNALHDAFNLLRNLKGDMKRILTENHEKAKKDGFFPENTRNTISIMETVWRHGVG